MRLVREFEDWYEDEGVHLAAAAAAAKEDGDHGRGRGSGGLGFHHFAGNEDKLDDGEKFDQMEVDRVRAQDPDSLAFFQAQKKMRQQQAAGAGAAAQSKSLRKGKRGV
jgi:kinesin family member 6/9